MKETLYSESFEAKLINSNHEKINKYAVLRDTLLEMKGVKSRITWKNEKFRYNKETIAVLTFSHTALILYLNVKEYDKTNKNIELVDTKKYEDTPIKINLKTNKNFKIALTLIQQLMDEKNIMDFRRKYNQPDYLDIYQPRTFEELIQLGLIKEVKVKDKMIIESKEQVETVGVKFVINLVKQSDVKELYLIGNIAELGSWNPKQGIKLEKINDKRYETNILIPINTILEFKISKDKTWYGVEKGIFKEEIRNHAYFINRDVIIEDKIFNFRDEKR